MYQPSPNSISFSRTNRKVILKAVHLTAGFPGKPGMTKASQENPPLSPFLPPCYASRAGPARNEPDMIAPPCGMRPRSKGEGGIFEPVEPIERIERSELFF
jgi:hypothetical protein